MASVGIPAGATTFADTSRGRCARTLWQSWWVVSGSDNDVVNASFRPPRGLGNGHLQSVRNRVFPRTYDLDAVSYGRTILVPTDDDSGDQLVVNLHSLPAVGRGMVLLIHGLGGSAESVYIRASAFALLRAGFNVARVDLRCAGASTQTSTLTYHAGKTDDLRAVLRSLAVRREALVEDSQPVLAVMGFSLGGAMTIKLLGEPLEGLPVAAGVAVSAPLDLVVGAEHLKRSAFGVYERAVLRGLLRDVRTPAPDGAPRLTPTEEAAISRARGLPDFDDALTAPRHGWRDAQEYYEVNSAAPFLSSIRVPTLVIHALDDPMIPAEPYLAVDWDALEHAGYVSRAITPHGGHVGFHERGNPMPWYANQAVGFLQQNLPAESAE